MQNLSDNDLDKHFQEAAEKFRPPYDPAAWQAMQKRLDKPDAGTWAGFQRGLPFLLIFLAGSVTGILTWSYYSTSNDRNEENRISHNIQSPDSVAGTARADRDQEDNPSPQKSAPAIGSSDIRLKLDTNDAIDQNSDSGLTSDRAFKSPEQKASKPRDNQIEPTRTNRNPGRLSDDRPELSDPRSNPAALEDDASNGASPLVAGAETDKANALPPEMAGIQEGQDNFHIVAAEEKPIA